jgi:hypothetical protein
MADYFTQAVVLPEALPASKFHLNVLTEIRDKIGFNSGVCFTKADYEGEEEFFEKFLEACREMGILEEEEGEGYFVNRDVALGLDYGKGNNQGDSYFYCEEFFGDYDLVFLQWLLKQLPEEEYPLLEVQWSNTCSKMRSDGYGGGAAIITRKRIYHWTSYQWAEQTKKRVLARLEKGRGPKKDLPSSTTSD